MDMKRLPNDIQTLFCASKQINSYKRAIEELVYNALDAESTSIAIRIHIEDNTVQVIDNGCGISESDFKLLGQRYTTSKCIDLSTLKAAPNKYGFRGQALASIIEVSQCVKISSRCKTKETWTKTFNKGTEQGVSETAQRPSKGTTIEIKGFLYNLNIQKMSVNILNEFNDIKNFLEQLSLVHSNISLSLRDDSKNEIVFKLHKKRNVFQTLSSLFGIDKAGIQELKVEKNLYKVTAFIGKKDKDINQHHWIYLNGKFVNSTKLHKVVNDNLTKLLCLNLKAAKKTKAKNTYQDEENDLSKNKVPSYFLFITCPYYDYDISYTPKQSVLEFRNWEQISKLLEKLVKFYAGDVNFKEIPKVNNNEIQTVDKADDTRDKVKKIIEKFLGSNSKKLGVSQMQNGVKGKLIKRKIKKKPQKVSVSKAVMPPNGNDVLNQDTKKLELNVSNTNEGPKKRKETIKTKTGKTKKSADTTKFHDNVKMKLLHKESNNIDSDLALDSPSKARIKEITKKVSYQNQGILKKTISNAHKIVKNKSDNVKSNVESDNIPNKMNQKLGKIVHRKKLETSKKEIKIKKQENIKRPSNKYRKPKDPRNEGNAKCFKDPLISKFKKDTNSVRKRCNMLAKQVDGLLSFKQKRKRKIFINETIQYRSVIKNDKNISIRKKIGEIVIHDYLPLPPKFDQCSFDNRFWDGIKKKTCKTSYDLVQTILKSQHIGKVKSASSSFPFESQEINLTPDCNEQPLQEPQKYDLPELTYESHNYNKNEGLQPTSNELDIDMYNSENKIGNIRFITKQSRDNFFVRKDGRISRKFKTGYKNPLHFRHMKPYEGRTTFRNDNDQNPLESFCTIEFSKSNENVVQENLNKDTLINTNALLAGTYTIDKNEECTPCRSFSINNDVCNIIPSNVYHENNESRVDLNKHINSKSQKTYTTQQSNKIVYYHQEQNNHASIQAEIRDKRNITYEENELDILITNSQPDEGHALANEDIDPMSICDTILHSHHNDVIEKELNFSEHRWNDLNENINWKSQKTYTTQESNKIVYYHQEQNNHASIQAEIRDNRNITYEENEQDILITNSQPDEGHALANKDIDPMSICDTILHSHHNDVIEKELNFSEHRLNDSFFNDDFYITSILCDRNAYTNTKNKSCLLMDTQNMIEEFSHHFNDQPNTSNLIPDHFVSDEFDEILHEYDRISYENIYIVGISKTVRHSERNVHFAKKSLDKRRQAANVPINECNDEENVTTICAKNFTFKNRLRFVPKGMSPIFNNCQSKNACDYILDKEYYKQAIYNKFANNVQINSEIFEPGIQNVKELTTRDIEKVNNRLDKDNASLIFNGESLKLANILGQVDNKFIAAKLNEKPCEPEQEVLEFLVLFDQHAVDERIQLEKNLADYFKEDQWKSVTLENISLKFSKDEVLYLHNYKDKFTQFGLQWTILSNCEVSISAIPKAVLGKNPRQVEVVMRAVKSLILEEINAIKSQRGCITLYPKSIMDLVCSEACRYAIKFGDRLSKIECADLIKSLSKCKTPFQCAHGRPVMAVLMNIEQEKHQYKINISKLHQFRKRMK